jgi:protein SCO1/2
MMKSITFLINGITTWIIIVSLLQGISFADLQENQPVQEQEIGIIEHLGEYAPLDLTFVDSRGDTVVLDSIVDKPTVISLVYYNCPGICSPLLSGKVDVLERLDMKPGVDYEAVTISFNPDDTPQLAREKKKNFFKAFRKGPFPEENWLWLTGDSVNIQQFTDAVGFKYKKVDQDYIHAGALIVLSKQGRISRYLRGIQFQPFDLKMALTEASEGRVGPTVNKVLLYCFSYDPEGKRYAFNFLRVFGTAFLVFLVGFIAFLTYQTKFRRNKEKD